MALSRAHAERIKETIRNASAAKLKTAALSMLEQVSKAGVEALDSPDDRELAWSADGGELALGAYWWALTGKELPGADDGDRRKETGNSLE
jgi:hypothetical protein